jgi:1-acyl-sn-glycerol-3-phosphate acyltransferase
MEGQQHTALVHSFFATMRFLNMYHRYSVAGTERIPKEGPALLLVNHSLATYDILMFGLAINVLTGRPPKGLGHRNFYATETLANWSRLAGIFAAGPDIGEKLLGEGNLVLLAPGGLWEALRPSTEKYQIRWNNRFGFAKLAIKTQVPVILAACPKADEMYSVAETPVTRALYNKFRLPLILARGLGLSLIPRPVKLTHYIREAILPPPFEGEDPPQEMIQDFQELLAREMEEWLHAHIEA